MIRRNGRKWIWWGVGFLLVAAITAAIIIAVNNSKEPKITGEQKQNQNQSQTVQTTEEETKTEDSNKQETEEPKKEEIKQYDGDSPNKSETLTGVISYAGVSGDNVIIRVNIDQYLTEGNCTLNMIQDNSTVYNSKVAIVSSVSTSTCDGFRIAASELSTGKKTIEVILESGSKYGKMVGELNI